MKALFPLLLLTFNLGGPRRVQQAWSARRDAIAQRLQSGDWGVVAYQELWRGEDLDALASSGKHPHRAFDPGLGLAVASRRPIEESATFDLGDGYGVLRARVAGADFYSARLEPESPGADGRRLGGLFRLAEFVRASSAGRPYVLLGDLGVATDEKNSEIFLDLLGARDLCVSHGDEVCGRTLEQRRVDFILIPYSSRAPRRPARAALTEPFQRPDDEEPTPLSRHFALEAELGPETARLSPSLRPDGRAEALQAVIAAAAAERAVRAAARREAAPIPFLGAAAWLQGRAEAARLAAIEEEARSALLRESRASN